MSYTNEGPHGQNIVNSVVRNARQNQYALLVLTCLANTNSALHVADLASDVADLKTESEDVKSIYIRLYHNHLPRLGKAGFVSFDHERRIVSLTEKGERVGHSLDDYADTL